MKIPKADETRQIIHKGAERTVIVHEVTPEIGTMWRVWVNSADDVFVNGDEVFWVDESGKQLPTFVRDLQRTDDSTRFALVAGESW
jgi:hypothetical protein